MVVPVAPPARKTQFQQRVNINRFIFTTPFTKTGKARTESVADQYIRKTILTTERHFPYIRTRLTVSEKEIIELNPLQHTIEEVRKQSAKIIAECNSENPSLKTLQPVLSGSVCLRKLFASCLNLIYNENILFRGTSWSFGILAGIFLG